MAIFDEICITLQAMGFTISTVKPPSFPPDLVYVYISDLGHTYESNMTFHVLTTIRIDWVDNELNLIDEKAASIMLAVERRLAQAIPAAVGTFKFRKPDIIPLGTAVKVSLKCTYTKVIDI